MSTTKTINEVRISECHEFTDSLIQSSLIAERSLIQSSLIAERSLIQTSLIAL
jgi:hypothetical protein